jgi:hypothetical protein
VLVVLIVAPPPVLLALLVLLLLEVAEPPAPQWGADASSFMQPSARGEANKNRATRKAGRCMS